MTLQGSTRPWLDLGLPLLAIATPLVVGLLPLDGSSGFYGEAGIVETATFLLALCGLLLAWMAATHLLEQRRALQALLLFLLALGFLYIAGEEIDWGQQWFGRGSAEPANLHSQSQTLERLPKALIGGFIIIAGIGWPLVQQRWHRRPDSPALDLILPTASTLAASIGFCLVWLMNRAVKRFDLPHGGESAFAGRDHLELLIVVFLVLHVAALARGFELSLANTLLRRYLVLVALPPLALSLAILVVAQLTATSCSPFYRAAPLTVEATADLGRPEWVEAVQNLDPGNTSLTDAVGRGQALGVCP